MNPSNSNNQIGPPDGQTTTPNWCRIAEALILPATQVVNYSLAETIGTGARTADQIMEIVVGHGLRWALPPELVPDIEIFVLNYLDRVAQQKSRIEEFLKRFSPGLRPSICYQVYHHGRTDYYYDELPKEVLNLKKDVLFWIHRSANELLSGGKPQEEVVSFVVEG